jgi:hypothetical protein
MDNIFSPPSTATRPVLNASNRGDNVPDSEKIVRLPMSSEDLYCPSVDIAEGGAALRVGGTDNPSVRYQFDIAETARECVPQGDNFSLTVGATGHLLIGPAGSPGTYSAPLRVTVQSEIDQKPAYSKVYKLEADTAGAAQTLFKFVSDPIVLPLTHPDLAADYSILIGFDNAPPAKALPPRKGHPAKADATH